MQISIALPDDVASSLEARWGSLERRILEMVVIEAYREGSISVGKLREVLGIATRLEADAFLKAKGIEIPYDEIDLEEDRQTHQTLQKLRTHP